MDFIKLAKKRFSSRSYSDKKIDKEIMLKVLEAARIAPSAANKQPWKFIIVDEPSLLEKVKSTYHKPWIQSAPAVIVICGDHDKSWKRAHDDKDHCDVDISIAIDHMTLEATDLGLATCWICMFDNIKCAEIFNLPDNMEAIALLPIGYPEDSKDPNRHDKARVSIDEIVSWNEFKS